MAHVTDGRLTGLVFGLLVLLAGSTLNTRGNRTYRWRTPDGGGIASRRITASDPMRKLADKIIRDRSTTQRSTDRHAGVPSRTGSPSLRIPRLYLEAAIHRHPSDPLKESSCNLC